MEKQDVEAGFLLSIPECRMAGFDIEMFSLKNPLITLRNRLLVLYKTIFTLRKGDCVRHKPLITSLPRLFLIPIIAGYPNAGKQGMNHFFGYSSTYGLG